MQQRLTTGDTVRRRDGTREIGWIMFIIESARGRMAWVLWRGLGARPEAVEDLTTAG